MKLLLWTEADPASAGVARALREAGHFAGQGPHPDLRLDSALHAALARVEGPLLSADFADRRFKPPHGERFERALFLSKHSAASGVPTFTVHPIGNLGNETAFGGQGRSLAPADPARMTRLLQALSPQARRAGLAASFEATHHGPSMDIPSLFVEVGSRPEDWGRMELCAALASAVVEGYLEEGPGPTEGAGRGEGAKRPGPAGPGAAPALGLGGGHYHSRHTDAARKQGVPIGHLIPAHALEAVDGPTLLAAAALSGARLALIDPKRAPQRALERARATLEAAGIATRVLEA